MPRSGLPRTGDLVLAGLISLLACGGPAALIPESPAGRQLAGWLDAFNSGDTAVMLRHARERWSTASVREMPAEERAAWDATIYRDNRRLQLRRVEPDGEHQLSALTQSQLTGGWLRVRIQVEPSPPHGIVELRIRMEPSPAPPATRPRITDSAIAREADALISRLAAADAFSGVVLVAKGGDTLLLRSVGMADRDARKANRPGTRFNIASMGKMFTAVAVAQLAQAGKLRFTDLVGTHLPDFPNRAVAGGVTLHHLLTHTSGLGMYWTPEYERVKNSLRTISGFLALVAADSPAFRPGERFQYSNNGFVLLGAVVERVSGQDYYDYLRGHVFEPAGMTATGSLEKGAVAPDLATGYTFLGADGRARLGGLSSNEGALGLRGSSAGGGHSTALDLLRFAEALRGHTLLDSAHTALVLEGKVTGDQGMYGYGFEVVRVNGQRIAGHSGGFPGVAARLDMFLDSGHTVVILGNYDSTATFAISTLFRELLTASP